MAEYISKAIALAENASKLSQRVSQGIVENARELGLDSASRYFDTSEEKMHDIRRQLDSRNDREKLDGLKRLIAMISKGRDVSEFFPDVVKNVASPNVEIRKLVYIYLLRYAEQEPDLALLSINTFQKDLTDQNQLIRAMALRVMSGIRVPVISPIVMLAIKKCVTDMSPYVRKTAAHAIPKCYSLDPMQEEALVEIIQQLLGDTSAITIGSVIMAFNEVCPERFDLIHPQYRKLCKMLVSTDEWGQMAIMGLLLRYGRTQFLNPNPTTDSTTTTVKRKSKKKRASSFYSDSNDDDDDDQEKKDDATASASESDDADDAGPWVLDEDHALLLKSCTPLLQSRNSGVVLSVTKIFYHLAPDAEAYKIGKPLARLLRTHRELQYVVLTNITTMASKRPQLFEPHMQSFFVRSTDPAFIRNLKLEVMTLIATDANISVLLKELQEYVKSPNKDFAAATIQAIGRCATSVPGTAERCLRGLMKLLWSKNGMLHAVVAESVIVIKRLLQLRPEDNADTINRLAKAFDHITVPMARASILWLIGQYGETLPKIGPDVLRKAVKGFTGEADVTKLQILTLAAKLVCLNPGHHTIHLLFQYVLNLARYDLNYDVRDRARFLRGLLLVDSAASADTSLPSSSHNLLNQHLKQILLTEKEVPVVESPSSGRERFTVGSLSLLLNRELPGYEPLPDYPEEQPDSSLRETKEEQWIGRQVIIEKGFGSDDFGSRYRGGFASDGGGANSVATYVAPKAKKKGDDYDLEAFYNDDDEEEEEEEEGGEEEETNEEDSEEESEEGDEDDSEEETEETEETETESEEEATSEPEDSNDDEEASDDDDYERQATTRLLGAR